MADAPAKVLDYAASVDRAGRLSAEGGPPLALAAEWSPEHLLLAALVRCTLSSLRYHARRAGLDVVGSGSAAGRVTRRESDGRYAFVEVEARLEAEVDPLPPGDELAALLIKAERDCFVGSSLTAPPSYRWRVNGEAVDPSRA